VGGDGSHLKLARCSKAGSLFDLSLEGSVDLVVGMAHDGRSPASHVVDVLVSIHIPAVGILDSLKDDGLASDGLESTHR
jgi:hypothetical protein